MKGVLLFAGLLLSVFCQAQPGYITNVAGSPTTFGFSGDGGPATASELNEAFGVAFDRSGNLFIADRDNYRVRKINTSGIITTFAGIGSIRYGGDGGAATAAELCSPWAVAVDTVGNVYVAVIDSGRIRKILPSGIITTIAGTGRTGYSGDGGPATAAQIFPYGIAVDDTGNVYIADYQNYRIRKVGVSGIITTIAGTGYPGYSGDGGAATSAQINAASGVTVDRIGNVYFADMGNSRVRKIDTHGIITTVAGSGTSGYSGDGGMATAAQLTSPCKVVLDAFGNIFIADVFNYRVRRVSRTGVISSIGGNGTITGVGCDSCPATSAMFEPEDIALDRSGNIFVASANLVRKIYGSLGAPTATADSFAVLTIPSCTMLEFAIAPAHYSSSLSVKTSFGDGSNQTDTFSAYAGYASFSHALSSSGTYSIKHVLYNGSTAIDSIMYTYAFSRCSSLPVNFYYDANGNCVKDTSEYPLPSVLTVKVDSNGVAIDTLSVTSGFCYNAYGSAGDVYAFTVIGTPSGLHVTCPSSGIIYDTIRSSAYAQPAKYMALECTTSSSFDIGVFSTGVRTGSHTHVGDIYAFNNYCTPTNAVVTLTYSPKHGYSNATPAPTSRTATSITWNLTGLSGSEAAPRHLFYHLETSGTHLTPGDTVNSMIVITPVTGDADTTNNHVIIVDTARSGYDPNAIYVKPGGCIASGAAATQLQYTITFENTGNDTAHNIYVMDTLPSYVDPSSMRLVIASHEMYTSKLKDASGQTILKFEFPNIKLLDSSHHGLCDGALIYTINTRPGLATGTDIMNRVGIYFDVNPVVMTNEAHNVIGCPSTIVKDQLSIINPTVYPNPANDVLNIDADHSAFEAFVITNNLGSVVAGGSITRAKTEVNIKSLPAGMYFVSLSGVSGKTVMRFLKD